MAQLAGAVEYNDCNSAAGQDSSDACPDNRTYQSVGEVSVMPEL